MADVDEGAVGPSTLRMDARRNRAMLLTVARTVFAERGTEASLRDVARRAGVGIGTLYRHFPTREALLEEVLREGFHELRVVAERLLTEADPGAALVRWLQEFVTRSGAYRGLPGSVLAALQDDHSELHAACNAMYVAAGSLLERAQQAGVARPDIGPTDLFTAAAAVGWAAEHSGPVPAAHLQAMVTDGLLLKNAR